MKYRLGTRKSLLATTQSNWVKNALSKHGVDVELVEIESEGDQNRSNPLYAIELETPGLFTKNLEKALLDNKIDLAVHSLKDLPTTQPSGLLVAAITKRENTSDCLVVGDHKIESISDLPKGAKVGTSSLRREAQLLNLRSDLNVVSIRGNVPTRLEHVKEKKVDAIVLASAGLNRLSLFPKELRFIELPLSQFVPAPGQGALAIEIHERAEARLREGIAQLNDSASEVETRVERKILKELEGGCTLPLGVRCVYGSKTLKVHTFLGLQKDRKNDPHSWASFEYFDISDALEQDAVKRTVEYFRRKIQ